MTLSFMVLVIIAIISSAQNPFASYGYKPKMATMTNGRYDECHDKSRIVEIGSVRFDTQTNKIVGLAQKDTPVAEVEAQTVSMFLSIDPHAERYYSISPYVYCMNNPVRIIDPNGKDGWDVVVGYGIGLVTDIIPGSGWIRDTYAPNDPSDYNDALRGVDNASLLVGNQMMDIGGGGMAVGSVAVAAGVTTTIASGGTLAVGGVPVAAGGAVLIKAGAVTAGTGVVLMANGKQNQDAGYNRGKKTASSPKGINQLQNDIKKGTAPNGIKRFDPGKAYKEQDHVHFEDNKNSALNKDGTWKHGNYDINREQKEYLKKNGWTIKD